MKNSTVPKVRRGLCGGLGLWLISSAAFGQATCTKTLTASDNSYAPSAGEVVCVPAGTTFAGTLTISSNNVTINNSGTISGAITVNSGATGTVINNLGSISTGSLMLNAATTLNNGSSTVASATWSGYVGGNITVAPLINNYGNWTAQLQPLPGGTINNLAGATWNSYMTTAANLTIVNNGSWQSQLQESYSGNPTITITQNGGSWTGGVGGGSGSLRIINNATWTKGFNFPGGSSNAFTTAAGATTTFDGYLGLNGTVALVNNGTMNLGSGMAALASGSTLTTGAGSTFSITGDLTNSGTIVNQGTIASANFTNNATITGAAALPRGRFTASGYTVNSGSFGADGSYLDFCDSTPPTPASNGFDARGGSIGSNVTYCAAATPLPVTLVSFGAQRQASQVLLRWTTASEQQSSYFELERSADGYAFGAFARVGGQGTAPTATSYTATDTSPLPGPSYYRLRQVDLDGRSTYSPVASVPAAEALLPAPYPNPTAGPLTLDLRAWAAAPAAVVLRDLLGQAVLAAELAGGQVHTLSMAGLPAGTYLLHLRVAGQLLAARRIYKQ